MFVLIVLACSTIEKISDTTDTTAGGGSCDDPIYVPQAGVDTTDPVLADAHAESYGSAPTPSQVRLSWAYEPSSSMSFVWRTDADTFATKVQVGTDTTYGLEASGASYTLLGGEDYGRLHEAHICGLQPGTTYHYRVGGDGGWSQDRTFTTAPIKGTTEPFRFVVSGDSRDNQAVWGEILDAAEAYAPNFYLFSGDAVDIGSNTDEWDAWLDAGLGHIDQRPIMMAHGNHEFLAQQYFGMLAQPGNELWFSFDYANGHFVFLNDTASSQDMADQADWLEADLANTTQKWRTVNHHKPAYSSCTTRGSDLTVREEWSAIEEAGGVVLDFTGHNHNYERSVPILNGQETTTANGTTYVVSAGAGADLYGNDMSQPFTVTATVDNHWVLVEIADSQLELTAYDLSGNVIDTFSATR